MWRVVVFVPQGASLSSVRPLTQYWTVKQAMLFEVLKPRHRRSTLQTDKTFGQGGWSRRSGRRTSVVVDMTTPVVPPREALSTSLAKIFLPGGMLDLSHSSCNKNQTSVVRALKRSALDKICS